MDFNLLQTLVFSSFIVSAILAVAVIDFRLRYLRLKQKNYFLNRDRDRYAETIYASKDGYFAFIYPDELIKDPLKTIKERCSRRLAVMLNLKNGRQSSFEDVLSVFYKEDARKLQKYLHLMREEGLSFEDTFVMKANKREMRIFGSRINGSDGNLYCDMLWFRDLSIEQARIEDLEKEGKEKDQTIKTLEALIDNLKTPVYLKNNKLETKVLNLSCLEVLGLADKKDFDKDRDITEIEKISKELSETAIQTNQVQQRYAQVVVNGQGKYYEFTEKPFHDADKLDEIGVVGQLIDMSELDEVKRHFKVHQSAHLEVLSALGTAFAIFDIKSELMFYNKSFVQMWNLNPEDLTEKLSYVSFLSLIRNKRLLPEVSDFKAYKAEEEKLFNSLINPKENLLHLPDGRTIRRLVLQHPNGLMFAYEDVSDRLAAERTIHELMNVQKNILDNVSDAVLIFEQDGELRYFNEPYVKLFNANVSQLQNLPQLSDVFEMQKSYFTRVDNWNNLKKHMSKHIFEICAPFKLERDDGQILDVHPVMLTNGLIMVTYVREK